jgi:hypothetical protein
VSIDNDVLQALEMCKGDTIAALRMVLIASAFYEEEIRRLKLGASAGYTRESPLRVRSSCWRSDVRVCRAPEIGLRAARLLGATRARA